MEVTSILRNHEYSQKAEEKLRNTESLKQCIHCYPLLKQARKVCPVVDQERDLNLKILQIPVSKELFYGEKTSSCLLINWTKYP